MNQWLRDFLRDANDFDKSRGAAAILTNSSGNISSRFLTCPNGPERLNIQEFPLGADISPLQIARLLPCPAILTNSNSDTSSRFLACPERLGP